MNYSCGNCKYARFNKEYLFPFKCMKDKAKSYGKGVFDKRIAEGYKCDKYEFGICGKGRNETDD